MSAFNILKEIETESRRNDGSAYELEILLRCGRLVRGVTAGSLNSYFLKIRQYEYDDLGNLKATQDSYVPYEAIDQITPVWL